MDRGTLICLRGPISLFLNSWCLGNDLFTVKIIVCLFVFSAEPCCPDSDEQTCMWFFRWNHHKLGFPPLVKIIYYSLRQQLRCKHFLCKGKAGSVRSSLPMFIKVMPQPLTVLNGDGSGIKSKYCIDYFKNSNSSQVFVVGKLQLK